MRILKVQISLTHRMYLLKNVASVFKDNDADALKKESRKHLITNSILLSIKMHQMHFSELFVAGIGLQKFDL